MNMSKEVFQPSDRIPLSKAVRANGMIFVSGAVGYKPGTREVAGPDVAAQTRQTLENIKEILEEMGSSMEKVVKTTVFLTDVATDFAEMNAVYAEFFPNDPPARSTIGVALAAPGLNVEIEAIALE